MDDMELRELAAAVVVCTEVRGPDPVWLDVAAGRVSAEEAAARLVDVDSPEEIARCRRLYAPLSHEMVERGVAAIFGRLEQDESRVSWWRSWWVFGGVGAVAAVALLLVLVWPKSPAPLPTYAALDFRGQFLEVRGDREPTVVRYLEDDTIELWMRPQATVAGSVDVVVHVRPEGGTARRIEVDSLVYETGAVRVQIDARAVGLSPGRWDVSVVVARPDHGVVFAMGRLRQPRIEPSRKAERDPDPIERGGSMSPRTRGRWGVVLLALGVVAAVIVAGRRWHADEGCGSAASTGGATLQPDWGRCIRVEVEAEGARDAVCVFDPNEPVRVWLWHEDAAGAEVTVDGLPADVKHFTVEEQPGVGLRVRLPPSAEHVEVCVPGPRGARWSLAVAANKEPVEGSSLYEIVSMSNDAIELLSGGDLHGGERKSREVIARAREEYQPGEALRVGLATVSFLWRAGDPEAAEDLLWEVRDLTKNNPQGRAEWSASWAHVQWQLGRLDSAVVGHRASVQYSLRVEDVRYSLEPLPMYVVSLAELGYLDAAAYWNDRVVVRLDEVFAGLSPDELPRWWCYRGSVLRTAAWAELLLMRRGHSHKDPVRLYEEAAKIFGADGGCPAPEKLPGIAVGVAEAHWIAGHDAEAARELARVKGGATPDEHMRLADLRVRIALRSDGDPPTVDEAIATLDAAVERVDTAEARWRRWVRRGDLLRHRGQHELALAPYRAAELEVERMMQLAALGIGRVTVGHSHREGTEGHTQALLALGREAEALCVQRQAQARLVQLVRIEHLPAARRATVVPLVQSYLRAKQDYDDRVQVDGAIETSATQRRKAQLDAQLNRVLAQIGGARTTPRCAQLPSRSDGELTVGVYPMGPDWVVFVQDARGTQAHWARAMEGAPQVARGQSVAELLTEHATPQIARAERMRVLAGGAARAIDVHALDHGGHALLEVLPVVYGVEVVARDMHPWPDPPRAALISDPTGTLRHTIEEVATIDSSLGAAGWERDVPTPSTVTASVFRTLVATATLLHFSGHTSYPGVREGGLWPPYDGGTRARASHIVLANEARFTVADVLLAEAVPRVVTLEGCQAGVLDTDLGGMSLAQAFIASGSETVIASPDEINDKWAAMLGTSLYGRRSASTRFDAVAALRTAQLGMRNDSDAKEEIWRYRAFVR